MFPVRSAISWIIITTALAGQIRGGHKQTSEVQSTTEAQAFFRKENMQKAGKAENVKKKLKLWVV